jgi:ketosteroid isomerase-like protein
MKKQLGWPAIILLLIAGCNGGSTTGTTDSVSDEVRALLAQQTADWNSGNVAAFMDGYWRDDRVRFASGGEVKRGWEKVMSDYELRYPDKDAMGTLRTVGVEISEIGNDAAMVFGQWVLSAGGVDYCGLFTLLVRQLDGRWVVVHDHTSSAGDPVAAGRSCQELAGSNG